MFPLNKLVPCAQTGSLQVFRSKTDHRTDENGSAIEACYNVEELEEPVHTAISTLCSSIQVCWTCTRNYTLLF